MPGIFSKYQINLWMLGWLIIFLSLGSGLYSQNHQNPFDIKSRTLIDTTQKTSGASEPANALESHESNNNFTDIHTSDSALIQELSTLSDNDSTTGSGLTVLPDTGAEFENTKTDTESENQIPITSADKSKKDDLSADIEGMKDVITLSGQSDTTLSWWYYVYDLVLLLVLLGAFLYDKKIFQPLRKAFIHENFLRFLYRDTYLRKPGLFIYLNSIFLLNLGFIIFRGAQYFGLASAFRDYIIVQGVVVLLFLIKHITLHILAGVVDKPFELKFYQYWMILSAGLIGLWTIPLSLMISVLPFQLLPIALVITGIIVVLLLSFRQAKAIMHAKFFLSKHFFQYILYFCAVEIIPALLLADILIHF